MAQIPVTFQCGHVEVIRDRPRTQAYWERRGTTEVCRECWLDQQNRDAAEAAKAQALPELRGTPRQIEWAETLRQEKLRQVAELESQILPGDTNRPTWDRLCRKLRAQTSASWWIDQRLHLPLETFRRWERERQEAARLKPVAELLGDQAPPTASSSVVTNGRAGFIIPKKPTPAQLQPAAEANPIPEIYESPAAKRARLLDID